MKEFSVDTTKTLLEIVQETMGFGSVSKARKFIKYGNVRVDDKVVTIPGMEVNAGQRVSFGERKKLQAKRKESAFPFEVYYEDPQVIAFAKPAGIPIRSENVKQSSVVRKLNSWLKKEGVDEDFFILNKIDKRESGIVLAVRDINLKTPLEREGWEERFYALVPGGPKDDDGIKVTLFRRNKIGLLLPTSDPKEGRECEVHFRVMKRGNGFSLLKVVPVTNTKNEVRASMAAMGHPVVGDKRYQSQTNPIGRLGIHVFSIRFKHPETDEMIEVKTPVPRPFLDVLKPSK
ncbi:MAG: hypothetical protein KDC12_03530 [Flavobacteriales bacterium]|nr:hypothetical protein [Flavobacteriales bacterium]